jgi:hypothetical protein
LNKSNTTIGYRESRPPVCLFTNNDYYFRLCYVTTIQVGKQYSDERTKRHGTPIILPM